MTSVLNDRDLAARHAIIKFQMVGRHDCIERAGDGEQRGDWCERCKPLVRSLRAPISDTALVRLPKRGVCELSYIGDKVFRYGKPGSKSLRQSAANGLVAMEMRQELPDDRGEICIPRIENVFPTVGGTSMKIKRWIRSGFNSASAVATSPPIECPMTVARSTLRLSRIA